MKTKPLHLRVTPGMQAQLDLIKRRDGVPVSEQVRRAITEWLKTKRQTKAGHDAPHDSGHRDGATRNAPDSRRRRSGPADDPAQRTELVPGGEAGIREAGEENPAVQAGVDR